MHVTPLLTLLLTTANNQSFWHRTHQTQVVGRKFNAPMMCNDGNCFEDISSLSRLSVAMRTTLIALPILAFISSPQSSIAAESFDEFFDQKYKDPRKVKARQELNKLKTFQDDRLQLCEDKGIDWEQCFMFGEFPKLQSKEAPVNPLNVKNKSGNSNFSIDGTSSRPQRPPTW